MEATEQQSDGLDGASALTPWLATPDPDRLPGSEGKDRRVWAVEAPDIWVKGNAHGQNYPENLSNWGEKHERIELFEGENPAQCGERLAASPRPPGVRDGPWDAMKGGTRPHRAGFSSSFTVFCCCCCCRATSHHIFQLPQI